MPVRSLTIDLRRERKSDGPLEEYPDDVDRPRTRADCANVPRPCPFVSCRHNLYLDVNPSGNLKINFPLLQPEEMHESCALDVADRGGGTLEEVATALHLTRERVRQLESIVGRKLRNRAAGRLKIYWEG